MKTIHRETGSYSHRPENTVAKAKEHRFTIGIDSLTKLPDSYTDGVPIYRVNEAKEMAKCHRALHLWADSPAPLHRPPRENYGKGMTEMQSKASALMEAVERFCGQQFDREAVVDNPDAAKWEEAVSLSTFRFPPLPAKCRKCPAFNRQCFQDLDLTAEEWVRGYSLIHDEPRLIPAAVVYYPYLSGSKKSFVFNDTGGLSAGNTLEEAILQGLCEVIEREALHRVFTLEDKQALEYVDYSLSDNKHLQDFHHRVLPSEKVFSFCIKNGENDAQVPVCTAFVCYEEEKPVFFGGSGANLDASVGMVRALTEMEQQKVRQKQLRVFDKKDLIKVDQNKEAGRKPKRLLKKEGRNIEEELEVIVDQLRELGFEVIVVDLTHPKIQIPVVRVIVPELIAYSGNLIRKTYLQELMALFG